MHEERRFRLSEFRKTKSTSINYLSLSISNELFKGELKDIRCDLYRSGNIVRAGVARSVY